MEGTGSPLRRAGVVTVVVLTVSLLALLLIPQILDTQDRPLEHQRLSVALDDQPASAMLWWASGHQEAEEKHRVHLTAVERHNDHECLRAVIDREADLAIASDSAIARGLSEDLPFVIYATLAQVKNFAALMVPEQSDIRSAGDLNDRRVAVAQQGPAGLFLENSLLLNQIDPSSVTFISPATNGLSKGLRNGEFDAAVATAPTRHRLMAQHRDLRLITEPGAFTGRWHLVGHVEKRAEMAPAVQQLLSLLIDLHEAPGNAHSEMMAIAAERMNLDQSLAAHVLADIDFAPILSQSVLLHLEELMRWQHPRDEEKEFIILDHFDPEPLFAVAPQRATFIR